MGIALGVGLLVGVRAATAGNLFLIVPLVLALAVLMVTLFSSWMKILPLVFGAGCLVGGTIGASRMPAPAGPLDDPSRTSFHGMVVSDPRIFETGVYVDFRWIDRSGDARESVLLLPPAPQVSAGDEISVSGEIAEFPDRLILGRAVRIDRGAGVMDETRSRLRRWIADGLQRYVPGSPGTLALGLVTGDDSGLTEREETDLRRSGLSHITAVSGWNVTLVLGIAGYLFVMLGRRDWYWLVVQAVVLSGYVWLIGLEPPIVRAAIMGGLGLIGFHIGRPAHTLTLLTLAAGIMAAISPDILGSLSFQLSVLSMIGLVIAVRFVSKLERPASILLAPAVLSGAAAIATAPLLAARFGTLSLATIPANVIVSFVVPIAAVAGVVTVLLQFVPIVAATAGWLVWGLCYLILGVARHMAGLPGAHWTFAPLSTAETVTLYLVLSMIALPVIPEGRAVVRELSSWVERVPARATLTGVGMSGAVVAVLLML